MFCPKCGKLNSDDAVYCQKCGAVPEPEVKTRVVTRPSSVSTSDGSEEREIFSISPTLLFVKAGYGLAVAAGIILVIVQAPSTRCFSMDRGSFRPFASRYSGLFPHSTKAHAIYLDGFEDRDRFRADLARRETCRWTAYKT